MQPPFSPNKIILAIITLQNVLYMNKRVAELKAETVAKKALEAGTQNG